jgi:hypothetical protein
VKRRAAAEVDKLLTELLPPTPPTDEALVAAVVDALGQMAADLTKMIETAETPEEVFAQVDALDVSRQLYRVATAIAHARRVLELRRVARRPT